MYLSVKLMSLQAHRIQKKAEHPHKVFLVLQQSIANVKTNL